MPDPTLCSFIWSVAEVLRGAYKQSDSGKVKLPFPVLPRPGCALEHSKAASTGSNARKNTA